MSLSDNEELERRWRQYRDERCVCGKLAHDMSNPGFCSEDCADDAISAHIDKHPIGRGRPHGGAVVAE